MKQERSGSKSKVVVILILILVILVLVLSTIIITGAVGGGQDISNGEVSVEEGWTTWDRDGLYFEYPEDFTVSYNYVDFASDIEIHKTNEREVFDECSKWYDMRGPDFPYSALDQWNALTELETNGLTYENADLMSKLDPVDCMLSGHHENMQPYMVGDLNGIVREFYRGSECCTFENFTKELTVVNQYNEVYTIMIRASMNELPQSERIPQGRWTDPQLDLFPFSWESYSAKNEIADKIFASVQFK